VAGRGCRLRDMAEPEEAVDQPAVPVPGQRSALRRPEVRLRRAVAIPADLGCLRSCRDLPSRPARQSRFRQGWCGQPSRVEPARSTVSAVGSRERGGVRLGGRRETRVVPLDRRTLATVENV
jgi:hypothetical protein